MARNLQTNQQGKPDEQITVLAAGQIKEIDMSPPGHRLDGNVVDRAAMSSEEVREFRAMIDPMQVAPIKRDAREAPIVQPGVLGSAPVMQGTREENVPKVRVYRVEKEHAIVDRTSGSRTKLREGKEISEAHYNIRDLQRQGAKLRDITHLDPNAPIA